MVKRPSSFGGRLTHFTIFTIFFKLPGKLTDYILLIYFLMSEAEKQLHRHFKPLVIGSNPICRTHATVAQQVEQEKTLFRYSRTFFS